LPGTYHTGLSENLSNKYLLPWLFYAVFVKNVKWFLKKKWKKVANSAKGVRGSPAEDSTTRRLLVRVFLAAPQAFIQSTFLVAL
jgi:hypothetical protein